MGETEVIKQIPVTVDGRRATGSSDVYFHFPDRFGEKAEGWWDRDFDLFGAALIELDELML